MLWNTPMIYSAPVAVNVWYLFTFCRFQIIDTGSIRKPNWSFASLFPCGENVLSGGNLVNLKSPTSDTTLDSLQTCDFSPFKGFKLGFHFHFVADMVYSGLPAVVRLHYWDALLVESSPSKVTSVSLATNRTNQEVKYQDLQWDTCLKYNNFCLFLTIKS